MLIRAERSADRAAVRALNLACFPGPDEADLVDRLRDDGDATISLVAESDGQIIGHVLFSPLTAPFKALGLAPVAVATDFRRQGIAAALIRAGHEAAQASGWQAIFVLGDTAYYTRFGFDVSLAAGFSSPYAGPHFMALSLHGDGLPVLAGVVEHAPAFRALG